MLQLEIEGQGGGGGWMTQVVIEAGADTARHYVLLVKIKHPGSG